MIYTPLALWKDYDRKASELNASVVSSCEQGGHKVSYVYFSGDSPLGGFIRIYAKHVVPQNSNGCAVLVMDDITNGVDGFDCNKFLSKGYSVLVVDYAGEAPSSKRCTIYPKTLSHLNYFSNTGCVNEIREEIKSSCRYIWSVIALRSITFLENAGYSRIGMLGVGEGSHQVFTTSFFADTLVCGATQFSGSFVTKPDEPDNELLSFIAAFDEMSYAPFIKNPVFIQAASNEQNSSLDRLDELFDACPDDMALFSVSEKCDRIINPEQSGNILLFFDSAFEGLELPKTPKLNAKCSQKSLYYNINVSDPDNIQSVKFFIAHHQKISAYRNWHRQPSEMVGEGEYLAKVTVYSSSEPVFAFVNVSYKNGISISSQLSEVIPASLGVEAAPFTQKRRIYDSDMDTSEWLVLDASSANDCTSMQEGPFSITGVTSSTLHLTTFVLADKLYTGKDDNSLQLIIYSPQEQTLSFSIKSSDGFNKYVAETNVSPLSNWSKITLSLSDFKCREKVLNSWSKIITFEISGSSTFLVNSMLWV